MAQNEINVGDYTCQSLGRIDLQSSGAGITIAANSLQGALMLNGTGGACLQSGPAFLGLSNEAGAAGNAALQVGELGTIKIGSGVPDLGSSITLEPELLTLAVGAPGVGASIKLTPESIIFKVGQVSFTMTPAGIVEDVLECTREVTAEGHNFMAAETEFNVGVAGETKEAPTCEAEVDAGAVVNATLCDQTIDAALSVEAATMMVV